MRYVTVVAYPDEEGINRLDRRVNELGLTQERLGVIKTRKKPRVTLSRFLE